MSRFLNDIKQAALEKRHSVYWPVPAYETPRFLHVSSRIFMISSIAVIVLNYLVALLSISECCASYSRDLLDRTAEFWLVSGRYQSLQMYDSISGTQYISIMWASLVFATLFASCMLLAYVNSTLRYARYVRMDNRAAIGFLFSSAGLSAISLSVFLYPVQQSDLKYIGMKAVLAWPVFPAFASVGAILLGMLQFLIVATILKIAIQLLDRRH